MITKTAVSGETPDGTFGRGPRRADSPREQQADRRHPIGIKRRSTLVVRPHPHAGAVAFADEHTVRGRGRENRMRDPSRIEGDTGAAGGMRGARGEPLQTFGFFRDRFAPFTATFNDALRTFRKSRAKPVVVRRKHLLNRQDMHAIFAHERKIPQADHFAFRQSRVDR